MTKLMLLCESLCNINRMFINAHFQGFLFLRGTLSQRHIHMYRLISTNIDPFQSDLAAFISRIQRVRRFNAPGLENKSGFLAGHPIQCIDRPAS